MKVPITRPVIQVMTILMPKLLRAGALYALATNAPSQNSFGTQSKCRGGVLALNIFLHFLDDLLCRCIHYRKLIAGFIIRWDAEVCYLCQHILVRDQTCLLIVMFDISITYSIKLSIRLSTLLLLGCDLNPSEIKKELSSLTYVRFSRWSKKGTLQT